MPDGARATPIWRRRCRPKPGFSAGRGAVGHCEPLERQRPIDRATDEELLSKAGQRPEQCGGLAPGETQNDCERRPLAPSLLLVVFYYGRQALDPAQVVPHRVCAAQGREAI